MPGNPSNWPRRLVERWPSADERRTGTRDATHRHPTVENDIRGVLIQVAGARLLLPNATIAEVLSYAEPDPVEDAPDWLLGRIRWRGWQLPLVAFARLAGLADEARRPGQQGRGAQGARRQFQARRTSRC